MEISDKIEYLHRIITGVSTGDTISMGMFDRLFAIGIITVFNDINRLLEKEVVSLDYELNLTAVSINFDKYLNREVWTNNWLFTDFEKLYKESGSPFSQGRKCTSEINQMMDFFPNGVKGYFFTPNTMESLKNAMHQLTDGEKLAERDVLYALNASLDRMLSLLEVVKQKTKHPKVHLFSKLWLDIYEIFDNDEFRKDYDEWKDENSDFSFKDLETRQKQEIYKLLKSGFFRFCSTPTGAEVRNCTIKITNDDLPIDSVIYENLNVDLAKFERFITLKGKYIISIDYEKLGQYIYKNYHKFEELEFYYITDFDRMLDAIHEDMATMKPVLVPYLKHSEELDAKEKLKEFVDILNTCQIHLAKGISKNFLSFFLETLLYNKEMRNEARKKLSGASKYTYICEIVAVLKTVHIFKPDCDKKDLAISLSQKIKKIKVNTISKNIERAYNANEGALLYWTKKNIDDIKVKSNNPFKDIL